VTKFSLIVTGQQHSDILKHSHDKVLTFQVNKKTTYSC